MQTHAGAFGIGAWVIGIFSLCHPVWFNRTDAKLEERDELTSRSTSRLLSSL